MKGGAKGWAALEWLETGTALERACVAFRAVRKPDEGRLVCIRGDAAEVFGAYSRCRSEGWGCALLASEWSPAQLAQSDAILGACEDVLPERAILVPTGGTGGVVKFAVHTGRTLEAAAHALVQRAGEGAVSACVLPATHVGGLMQAERAVVGGGKVRVLEWKRLEADPALLEGVDWVSLVPTQLARLMTRLGAAERLRALRRIFVGGAGAAADLLQHCREVRLPLSPAYGSTETAAQVCMLEPEEFLAGFEGVGRALPHAKVHIENGEIVVDAASLFIGYAGAGPRQGAWRSGDAGVLDPADRLRVIGRLDDLINTGGEKVAPAEVERAVVACGLAREVVAVGVPDAEWGSRVVVLVAGPAPDAQACKAALAASLPRHALPKAWISVEAIPLTLLGKPDRSAARALALARLGQRT